MAWVVYEIPPIDFGWEFLPKVTDVAVRMASGGALVAVNEAITSGFDEVTNFAKAFHEAQDLASEHGWESDFREPARVICLPAEYSPEFIYAFVWKQDHNGTTYVVSPHPLPWLGEPAQPRPPRGWPST
jgi:hypothetical protein